MKRNSKKLVSLIAVLCVFLAGGTIAYFSDRESAKNTFAMGKFDTVLNEEFDPPSDWKPGTEIDKKVKVDNTGTVDMVVTARFDESCIRREDVYLKKYNEETKQLEDLLAAKAGEELPVIFDVVKEGETITSYKEVGIKKFGTEVVKYTPGTDPADYEGKWVYSYNPQTCVYQFIYMGIVKSGDSTPYLLQSVTMNPALNSTVSKTSQTAYYDKEKGESVKTFAFETSEKGYDNASYHLNITAKSLQASAKAIQSDWAAGTEMIPAEFQELLTHLASMCQ